MDVQLELVYILFVCCNACMSSSLATLYAAGRFAGRHANLPSIVRAYSGPARRPLRKRVLLQYRFMCTPAKTSSRISWLYVRRGTLGSMADDEKQSPFSA